MLALRATGNFDRTSVQFMLAPYSLSDELEKGLYASLWVGQSWQVKNWQFHSSLGLTYRSADILDHYYSISDEEATEHFQAYKAGSGIDVTGQLTASYPISSNLLFESYIKYTDFSSSANDNPVMQYASKIADRSEQMTEFGVLVSYVF
jgi:outer membrane scaffolding protein for murein synthesis (MipA/OmpV family)